MVPICAVQASGASAAWLVHWIVLKAVLYALGIPSAVPFLEVVAYAGYPFVPTCLAMGVNVLFGEPAWAMCLPIDCSLACRSDVDAHALGVEKLHEDANAKHVHWQAAQHVLGMRLGGIPCKHEDHMFI